MNSSGEGSGLASDNLYQFRIYIFTELIGHHIGAEGHVFPARTIREEMEKCIPLNKPESYLHAIFSDYRYTVRAGDIKNVMVHLLEL